MLLTLVLVFLRVYLSLADDEQALLQFYSDCKGTEWVTPWDTSNTSLYCSYFGITCDTNDRVVRLNMSSNHVECPFPASLCELTNLEALDLSDNSLSSPIPNCIADLTNLQTIKLNSNSFSQSFPEELCSLTGLTEIDLSYSGLTGNFSECLVDMTNLVDLNLRGNELGGLLPNDINNLQNLLTLNLGSNDFYGTIPASFCELAGLESLDLSQNMLGGTIPDCIGNLTNIQVLLLYTNEFYGTIPNTVSNLVNVYYLDFSVNMLTGSVPIGFCNMAHLEQLYLSVNRLSDAIDPCLGELQDLAWIDFSNNLLSGSIPETFSSMTNMISLTLGDNEFSGYVPSFTNMSLLQILDLSNNNFDGTYIDIGQGLQINNLFLKGNHFSGTLPDDICGYTNLQIFNIENNQFTGNLPDCIDQWQSLQNLEITGNRFSGSLSASIGSLTSLRFLRCGSNNFTGVLPSTFENLVNLRWLDASSNPFGTELEDLSRALFLLPDLMYLNLANTSSIGTVAYPMFWMDSADGGQVTFPSLVHADLHNNQLTGTIPAYINWWQRIAEIDLSHNFFEGTIPRTVRLFYNVNLGSNPGLRSDTGSLPSFLSPNYNVSTLNQTGNFHCPSLLSTDYPIAINIDPLYYNYSACSCAGNFFGINGTCAPCLENGKCPGGAFVTVNPGYYPTPSFEAPEKLIECTSNSDEVSSCNPNSDPIFKCAEGYHGRKCSKCDNDHYFSGSKCKLCTGRSYIFGSIVVVIVIIIFTITLMHMRIPSKYGTFKILLLWGQTVSALLNTELPWPHSFTFFQDSVDVSTVGINGIFGFECMFSEPNSPIVRFYLGVVTPGLLVLYDCLLFSLLYAATFYSGQKITTFKKLWIDFIRFIVYSTSLFYFPVAKTVLSAFNCETDPVTNIKYLASSPFLVCASGTLWSQKILPAAVILTALFVVGFPALLVYILFAYRKNLHSESFQSTIGFIFTPFKKKLFYFGYLQIGRSLLLSIIIGILPESSTFRRLLILVSLLCFLAAQLQLRPYVHTTDNYLEAASLMVLIITYVAGLSFGSLNSSPDIIATSVFVITINGIFVAVLVLILCRRFHRIFRDMLASAKAAESTPNGNFITRSFSVILQIVPSHRGSFSMNSSPSSPSSSVSPSPASQTPRHASPPEPIHKYAFSETLAESTNSSADSPVMTELMPIVKSSSKKLGALSKDDVDSSDSENEDERGKVEELDSSSDEANAQVDVVHSV
jgi:Leucine-rich repeat (LRR) protein